MTFIKNGFDVITCSTNAEGLINWVMRSIQKNIVATYILLRPTYQKKSVT